MLEGAVDCIVVKVVVSDRSEWLGEEKVLPPPTVLLLPVSAFDLPECTVSGCVATVGAVDLLLFASGWRRPELGSSADVKLSFAERGVTGLPNERWPSGASLR
jgi:hypothetical protein